MNHPTTPFLPPAERLTRDTFLNLMWALSHPGRRYRLASAGQEPFGAFVAVGRTLLDLETSFFTPDAELDAHLARTGARGRLASESEYHFYPTLGEADLAWVADAPVGTLEYPDRGATLVVGCAFAEGRTLRLSGPGIERDTRVSVGGVPDEFWNLRSRLIRYPQGVDVFLLGGAEVVGLPRSCSVEVI